MNVVCLDMEGVLVPEIWIAFSEESGIPELSRTTRDEPDYDKLMKWRIGILRERGLKLKDVQDTISRIDPLPGAKEFLDELRSVTQVIVLSDTFSQFAQPLMKKLGWPTLFCNELIKDEVRAFEAHDGQGTSVDRLRHHSRGRQLQRPRDDTGEQGGVPLQDHRSDQKGLAAVPGVRGV